MFDLRLTAEQLEFRDTVRDFVDHEVKPAALNPARLEPFEKQDRPSLDQRITRPPVRKPELLNAEAPSE